MSHIQSSVSMLPAKPYHHLCEIYSCPMKMHHSSDALLCDLSKAVQLVLFIFILYDKCNVFAQ